MDSALIRHAEQLFGEGVARKPESQEDGQNEASPSPETDPAADAAPSIASLNLTLRNQSKLWRHVQSIENFWETLDALEPDVLPRLAAIAAERRWEVIFLTKRPETAGATAQVQSQRWLEAKGFPLPSVYVVHGSRGLVAAALGLDLVVDDRPENCLDVAIDSKARAILVWRDQTDVPPATKRLGIGVVKSVAECLDLLTKADTPEPEQGLLARVMKALGLKETANA